MSKYKQETYERADPNYRIDEIRPEIKEMLEKYKKKNFWLLTERRIDIIIDLQNNDYEKCVAYIGYRYLGTHTYLDVYGPQAEADRTIKKLTKEAEELRKTIEELNNTIAELKNDLKEARVIPAELEIKTADNKYLLM